MQSARVRKRVVSGGIVLAALLIWPSTRPAAEKLPAHFIKYGNDVLTVHLVNVPVSGILQELAVQGGVEIRGHVREPRDVTADFNSVPLPEALARLLRDQNFALVYGQGGRLKAVRLLGGPQLAAEAPAPPPSTVPLAAPRTPFPGSLEQLIDRHPAIPVTGALADALASQSATLRQLVGLTLHHPDATVRAEALRTGIETLEAEPELFSPVVTALNDADSALVASLLRASAGEHAEVVARQVLREARAAQIRLKASSVLQRLGSGN